MRPLLPLLLLLTACTREPALPDGGGKEVAWPANFPAPIYDLTANPPDEAAFALGKRLFYDPILSRDSTVSCGSCHLQEAAFADGGRALSLGIGQQSGKRNTPALQNLMWKKSFFWDGGVFHLDLVPLAPLDNALELDLPGPQALERLRRHKDYPEHFRQVTGSSAISSQDFLQALSQFMAALVSADSRYDRYVRGEGEQLDVEELAGLEIFRQKCAGCHATDLFSDGSFRNNGLSDDFSADRGRYDISLLDGDIGKFKVPSLRNAAKTAPYMHDGRLASLEAVLDHYAGGVKVSPSLDPLLRPSGGGLGIPLTATEKQRLLAFLQTLTDEAFLTNPRFSNQ